MSRALTAGVLLLGAGCLDPPPDHELRYGLTEEDLKAGPSHHQMMGALLQDVRVWRELDRKLGEGRTLCTGILFEDNVPLCANDRTEMELYVFPEKEPDALYRVQESAFYCRREGIYYYHYVGGPRSLNVWLGPFPLKRERPKLPE